MNQRLIAAVIAVPLVLGLLVTAAFMPLPYVSYKPGYTVDVLAKDDNSAEIIQVLGAKTYRDDGELRMTTVLVTPPEQQRNLFDLMYTWIDSDDAVYPYEAVYQEDTTEQENSREGAVDMVTSQDSAIAVALTELGYEVNSALQVAYVEPGTPAESKLQVRDILRSVNGEPIKTAEQLVAGINAGDPGSAVELGITRRDKDRTISVVPEQQDGQQLIGITPGIGYDFPFDVTVNISPDISGPSAGLMFSLAIYDTLTPGSLTDGGIVAGTGEIFADGTVGPIGGIQQKIAGARDSGVELFLVPEANCQEALGADSGDMRLVRAETMGSAREAIEAWADDRAADLPSCADAA